MTTAMSPETDLSEGPPANLVERPVRPANRRRQLTRFGLILLIFGSGVIVGSGATATWLRQRERPVFRSDPGAARERMVARLDRKFGLSPEQKQQAEAVIDGHFERFRSFREQMKPLVSAEMDRFQTEIGDLLDEEQRKSWKEDSESFRQLIWPRGPHGHRHRHRGKRSERSRSDSESTSDGSRTDSTTDAVDRPNPPASPAVSVEKDTARPEPAE